MRMFLFVFVDETSDDFDLLLSTISDCPTLPLLKSMYAIVTTSLVELHRQLQVTMAYSLTCARQRYPGLDDQTVFWNVIRRNSEPRINPIGTCRNLAHSNSMEFDPDPPLATCYLDICMFSSGMMSANRHPALQYRKSVQDNM